MKFSEHWLREWVSPDSTTAQLAAQLTMAGLEVDSVTPVAGAFTNIVVGEVLSVAPHPNAEKLQVCKVNVGESAPLQIVCGAANVAAGLRVPCARLGAELPGGMKIKPATLRGVESSGMLCSAKELGMAESAEGLMILPADAVAGTDVRRVLGCDDVSIELGLTPNRSDCLSVAGIAREVGVLNRLPFKVPQIDSIAPSMVDVFPVEIQVPAACPRYVGRVLKGVRTNIASPLWLQERLRRSGVRSISVVVDVTNYVMLELGQPMHAFDLAKLHGGIVVRKARADEKIKLLDGRDVTLTPETLVIADARAPQAIAGVMGGMDSAVGETTRDIFLESAFFAPIAVAGRARAFGMHTDSAHRFERGVDPQLQSRAVERATALILQITGGQAGPVIDVTHAAHLPLSNPIMLRRARITRVLGITIPDEQVLDILTRLGMTVTAAAAGWSVASPLFRFDVALEVDLIEELARVFGYDQIPKQRPRAAFVMLPVPDAGVDINEVRESLLRRGYQEVLTYSFVDPKLQQLLDPARTPIALTNPIASDMSVMRTGLWPGMVKTLLHNLNRQQERVRIFESGLRFIQNTEVIQQDTVIGGLVYGAVEPQQWGAPKRAADFFDVKADVAQLLQLAGTSPGFEFTRVEHPALHPGRSAAITRAGQILGWIGELHPSVVQQLDLPAAPYLFEIEYSAVASSAPRRYREISRFPSIRRDIAVVLGEAVAYTAVERCIRAAAPELLTHLQLFDVYKGKGIEPGSKSLALGLTFQTLERTLGDSDVDTALQHILTALAQHFGAKLRS